MKNIYYLLFLFLFSCKKDVITTVVIPPIENTVIKKDTVNVFTGYKVNSNAKQLGRNYWENITITSELMLSVFQTPILTNTEIETQSVSFGDFNLDGYIDIFNFIKDGPIKSDFWRVCILYAYGGVYSDIDIEPISRLNTILHNKISFLTVKRNMDYMFNPHFIASVKNNIILKEIIDKYIFYYENNFTYKYWKWSILNISQPIINKYIGYNIQEGFYKYNDVYCKIITENISFKNLLLNRYKAYNSYNNTVLFNTRYLTYDELNHTY